MSLNHAVDDTGLSKQNIRTAIKALVNFKMIEKSTQELTQQATVISICNYSLYQKNKSVANTVINTDPTQTQHSANTGPTLDKEPLSTIKNSKNKNSSVTSDYSEAFERWWLIYPKRDGRVRGKKKSYPFFKKILSSQYQDLKTATGNYSKESFIKDPERFLANDYWKDFIDEINPSGGGQPKESFKATELTEEQKQKQIEINKQNSGRIT